MGGVRGDAHQMRDNFKNNTGLPKSLEKARNLLDTLITWKEKAEVDDLIKIVEDLISSFVAKGKEKEMKKKMEEENATREEGKVNKRMTEEKKNEESEGEIGRTNEKLIDQCDHCSFLQDFLQNVQNSMRTEQDDKVVVNCCKDMEALVHANLSGKWSVQPFGSAVNGFGTRNSDIDVTIFEVDQKSDAKSVLEKLLKVSQNSGHGVIGARFSVTEAILNARVPILKLVYHDDCSGRQEVDLSVHNRAPLLNTQLLLKYSSIDVRVRQLVVAVKLWAKKHNVCGASVLQKKMRFLPAYAWNLMAIYFLQVKVGLPGPFQANMNWECKLSLDSLFTEFFVWYADEFGWCNEVVSLRTGRRVDKEGAEFQALDKRRRKLLIEDPYITTRNLSDVLTDEAELETYKAIMNMARKCKSYRTESSASESSSAVLLFLPLPPSCYSCFLCSAISPANPKLRRKRLVNKKLDEPEVKDAQDKYFLKTPKCSMTGSAYDMYENLSPSNGIPLPAKLPVNWRPPPGLEPIMPGLLSMMNEDHGY